MSVWPLVPPDAATAFLQRRLRTPAPQERFAAFMFIDMRNSTQLAAGRLPFDSVFIINRFLGAVCAAITEAGGLPNQFLGDGVLAIFGVDSEPDAACRQAIAALPQIAANVEKLNAGLALQLQQPIRFGIGLHCGLAVIGEIGFGEHVTMTAVGDPLNVAARLEQLTKEMACEAIVSDEVFAQAGIPPGDLPRLDARLRGRDDAVAVRLLASAAAFAEAASLG